MDITQYFTDYTLRTITLGTAVLGAICGMLGSFAVLRKQSLLGDAISHAALPGIAVAFLITGAKDSNVLLLGALVSGLIGVFWIRGITTKTHLKTDTALGLILSLFFGFGMLLLTYIQKQPNANQAGLDKYLFGQAATLVESDVLLMVIVTGISLLVMLLFWKEFKLLLFDKNYAMTLGFNTKFIDGLISFFIVLAIVIGLQTVGVVLMSAMLLAPAAAARQWTNSLSTMVILAAIFGAFSGVFGTAISASQNNLSTGPVIVLVAAIFVIVSFLFSPERGIIFKQIRLIKNRRDLQLKKTLYFMYDIVRDHDDISRPHAIRILNSFQGFTKKTLSKLEEKNWITIQGQNWSMTEDGFETAANLYNNNLPES
ncbi:MULTISPECIES: metal ABC transporter permease [Nonlabens]|uniref:Manganese ABC transporter n=1 Tax=Nonlabens ulvanivorans TaxID=906888 RepID=A0A084JTN4_NONUL|nr:metal ABC transporter permease [Nonlabens ulvanivorans]KEZ92318.1 zinc transport system membrane protein TroC [Nonlabens ulvanivorans]PRX15151.1 manganese/zinc/iron transport system permease protein [Nonlabens ulvanivorans]WOI22497.1 metal ABC transporter permease [Nonlabens ulvanivorans]GAK74930.1 manganese ABC transporter [Nonlabens ulvanivorans]GAK98804.1 manganese ABC transporter inner membrane permease protein SitC [Nonlabens ulvanivorans]